jgi:protocatechuate 3,4-dioxygenase beta subunit
MPYINRRSMLKSTSFVAAAMVTPGLLAEELAKTPPQTEGPFYPDKMPLDTDNDLLVINDALDPGVGEITHLTGRVLDVHGALVKNTVVEIWQVDNQGAYLHTKGESGNGRDKNFQGFGRFFTGPTGEYYFRTIKPVPYPGRTPHIHVAVNHKNKRLLTTQCYVKGEPLNQKDGILRRIKDQKVRDNIILDFKPVKGSKIGELAAHFDIVLGATPEA